MSKKVLPDKKVIAAPSPPVPWIMLECREPRWAFAFWQIPELDKYPFPSSSSDQETREVLRIHEVSRRSFTGKFFDEEVKERKGGWHFFLRDPFEEFCAEIGIAGETFLPLARSPIVSSPVSSPLMSHKHLPSFEAKGAYQCPTSPPPLSSQPKGSLTLMVKDPYWSYTYWSLSPQMVEEKIKELSLERKECQQVLRTLQVSSTSIVEEQEEIAIKIEAGLWYIPLEQKEGEFCLEIGLRPKGGSFHPLARSNIVENPTKDRPLKRETQWGGPGGRPLTAAQVPAPLKRIAAKPFLFEKERSYAPLPLWSGSLDKGEPKG